MRFALDIAYKGTQYAGWQVQPNAVTVQEILDQALSTLLRSPVRSVGAGRTDAGVHAAQLIVHFDAPGPLPPRFLNGLNGILPKDIAVKQIFTPSNPDFHARFDALFRAYQYHLIFRKSPFHQESAWWIRRSLDREKMEEASRALLDYQDFASFCKVHHQSKTTLCDLKDAHWESDKDTWVFHIRANRFLRGMVRAVVGTLVEVGSGKLSLQDFRGVIEARDRKKAGANAPAGGLFLTEIGYEKGALVPFNPKAFQV